MERNVHNEDEFFKKAYERLEEEPSPEVWEKISAGLDKADVVYYRGKFETWKRIACLLLLLLTLIVLYQLYSPEKPPVVTQTEKTKKSGITNKQLTSSEKYAANKNTVRKQNTVPADMAPKANNKPTNESQASADNTYQRQQPAQSVRDAEEGYKNLRAKHNSNLGLHVAEPDSIKQPSRSFLLPPPGISDSSESRVTEVFRNPKAIGKDSIRNHQSVPGTEAETQISSVTQTAPPQPDSSATSTPPVAMIKKQTGRTKKSFARFWTFAPFASADFTGYHLDDDETVDNPNQRDHDKMDIEHRETHQFSFSAGALAKWQFSRKLSLKMGLVYSNINIGIQPQTLYASKDNNQTISYKFISSSGYAYVKPVFGSSPATGDSIAIAVSHHHLQFLSLPLTAGYKVNLGRRLTVTPGAGLSLNLLLSTKVRTELNEDTGKEMVVINKLQGLRKTYFSFLADAEITYSVTRRINLVMLPVFKYAVSPITKDNVVKTYPYSFSLGAGVSYRF